MYIYLTFNNYFLIDTIRRLCEEGLPIEKYFDLCANYILEYDLIRKSGIVTTEGTLDENQNINKNNNINNINSNNNNNIIKVENNNLSIEQKLKLKLEIKNESIKNDL